MKCPPNPGICIPRWRYAPSGPGGCPPAAGQRPGCRRIPDPRFDFNHALPPLPHAHSKWLCIYRGIPSFCWTRLAISIDPESFFLIFSRAFSAVSRLRLLMSTCSGVEVQNKHVKDLSSFDLGNLRWSKVVICTASPQFPGSVC